MSRSNGDDNVTEAVEPQQLEGKDKQMQLQEFWQYINCLHMLQQRQQLSHDDQGSEPQQPQSSRPPERETARIQQQQHLPLESQRVVHNPSTALAASEVVDLTDEVELDAGESSAVSRTSVSCDIVPSAKRPCLSVGVLRPFGRRPAQEQHASAQAPAATPLGEKPELKSAVQRETAAAGDHGVIVWDPSGQRFTFSFKLATGEAIHFETMVHAANDSKDVAERICRLCRVRFLQGASLEEVLSYRDDLYGMCTALSKRAVAEIDLESQAGAAAHSRKDSLHALACSVHHKTVTKRADVFDSGAGATALHREVQCSVQDKTVTSWGVGVATATDNDLIRQAEDNPVDALEPQGFVQVCGCESKLLLRVFDMFKRHGWPTPEDRYTRKSISELLGVRLNGSRRTKCAASGAGGATYLGWVAQCGNPEPLAAAIISVYDYQDCRRCGCLEYIVSRQRGAGSVLLNSAKDFLMQLKIFKLFAGVDLSRPWALKAHSKWGFKPVTLEIWANAKLALYQRGDVRYMLLDLQLHT